MNLISDERGNALLEGVSFAALGFGLVLSLGLHLYQVQEDQLELQGLARNLTRVIALHPEVNANDELNNLKFLSKSWRDKEINLEVFCEEPCVSGSVLHLRLSGSGLTAISFGISGG